MRSKESSGNDPDGFVKIPISALRAVFYKCIKSLRRLAVPCLMIAMIAASACAPRGIPPTPDTAARTERSAPAEQQEKDPAAESPATEPGPRLLASLELTREARSLIDAGRADHAIRMLERAMALDSSNGQNYYYLSEAWLLKGDTIQAGHFNELAFIHLRTDDTWRPRVLNQKDRIKARTD